MLAGELGAHREALRDCREALRLRRSLADAAAIAETAANTALALETLGRPELAEPLYREAIALDRRLGDRQAEAIDLGNLGALMVAVGRYSEAMELYRAAAALATAAADEEWGPTQLRAARINQGVVLEKLGAYRDAVRLYRELLAEPPADDPRSHAALLVNAGVVHRNLGDPVSAARSFTAAAELYEGEGDLSGLANATLNLGLAEHLGLRRPRAAEAAYRRALALARQSGDHGEEVQSLFYLGRLLLETGRLDEAAGVFRECRAAAETGDSAEGRWSALEGLARVAAARGGLPRAVELFEAALAEIERVGGAVRQADWRAGYYGDRRSAYEGAVAVLARLAAAEPRHGHAARALRVVHRAKARDLAEALGLVAVRLDLAAREGQEAATPGGGSDGSEGVGDSAVGTATPGAGAAGPSTPRAAGPAAGEAAPGAPAPRAADGPPAASTLPALPRRATLLEYFVAEGDLYRFVVRDGAVTVAALGPAAPVEADVRQVHLALAAGDDPRAEGLARLARTLLPAAAVEGRLLVSPDGVLAYLPFEVLPQAGHPLVEVAAVSYLPSGALADRAASGGALADRTASGRSLARSWRRLRLVGFARSAGGPTSAAPGAPRLPRLAHADAELTAVASALGGRQRLYRGTAATEAALRNALAARPRVVHVAAHAVVGDGPATRSAVLLAPSAGLDGRLTAREVTRGRGGADLVVLAACRTALPAPGEEARALGTFTGAFLAAGSDAVVATLWDVDDAATATFMARFYRELRRGARPADALRATKRALREDPRWRRPALWSAYVLVGDAPPVAPSPWTPRLVAAALAVAAAGWWLRDRRRRAAGRSA